MTRATRDAVVRLLVEGNRAGDRLASWVGERPGLRLADSPESPADLCIADPVGMRRHAAEIAARQEEVAGWLPVLLVVPARRDASPEDLAAFEAEHGVHIDATLQAPLRDATLGRQVETLLRGGRLSRELSETEGRYRALVELSPEAILVLRGDEIRYANDAARELLGTDALTERSLTAFLPPEDRERAASVLAGVDESFVPVQITGTDGRCVPCELAATDIRYGDEPAVQVVLRDVSERAQNEERLRLYRRAMDDAHQGITIADANADDLPVVYANQAFERITGYPPDEILGRNCRFLQGPGTDEETVDVIREGIESERPVAVEILNYRRDGTPFWNQLHITPIRDAAGEVTHYVGLQRDITESKRRFQRLSVLDRVLRHNIRNKTNVIAGHAADIEADEAEDPKAAARIVQDAAADLLSLSEAARKFHTAMDEQERTVRDMAEIADAAVAAAREEHDDASLTLRAERAEATVTPAIQLAVEELLTNAIEHSDRERPTVNVSVRAVGPWAEITVADDGPGIPDSVLGVVQSRGETPTEHLSRLGLWLVRWAVQAAGGELDFERGDPRGAVVRIRLPRSGATGTPEVGTDTD